MIPHQSRTNYLPQVVQLLSSLRPRDLVSGDARDLLTALQSVKPTLTRHSVKRGAMTQLSEAIAQQGLDPKLIPLMGKHAHDTNVLPPSTIRYLQDPIQIARLLGTRVATALL